MWSVILSSIWPSWASELRSSTPRWPASAGERSRKEEKSQVLAFDYVYGHSDESLSFRGCETLMI